MKSGLPDSAAALSVGLAQYGYVPTWLDLSDTRDPAAPHCSLCTLLFAGVMLVHQKDMDPIQGLSRGLNMIPIENPMSILNMALYYP